MDDASSGMQASPAPPAAETGAKSDTDKLHDLGYAQELKRGMGAFSNFAVSFTIISILSGCLTLFGYGMSVGGPASAAYGWPVDLTDDDLLARLLELNLSRAAAERDSAG